MIPPHPTWFSALTITFQITLRKKVALFHIKLLPFFHIPSFFVKDKSRVVPIKASKAYRGSGITPPLIFLPVRG